MLNWILPIGWMLLMFDEAHGRATCKDGNDSIIVIDMNGV